MDVSMEPGSGAAGAMGAGMLAFFGAKLRSGIEVVLDVVRFDELLLGADFVLTGEGKMDAQSLRGKVPIGVARRAKASGVPVIAIVGDIGDNMESAYLEGITAILSTNRVAVDFGKARGRSESDLALTVDTLMRLLAVSGIRQPD
jgi:glycerate kinase